MKVTAKAPIWTTTAPSLVALSQKLVFIQFAIFPHSQPSCFGFLFQLFEPSQRLASCLFPRLQLPRHHCQAFPNHLSVDALLQAGLWAHQREIKRALRYTVDAGHELASVSLLANEAERILQIMRCCGRL